MPLYFSPLRSGSSGNALYVGTDRTRVLVDAGLSGRMVEGALRGVEVDPATLQAILVTHEHSDHIKGVAILSRRYNLPVYATEGTWLALERKPGFDAVALKNRRVFTAGEGFYIGDLTVCPFPIPHDAADPVGFSLLNGGRKLCVATDIGHVASPWMQAVKGADLALLESNHDPRLLQASVRYPAVLKRRILGKRGHLSNADCGEALIQLFASGLRHAILGHLSAETNTPALARETVLTTLLRERIRPGVDVQVDLAPRDACGGYYALD